MICKFSNDYLMDGFTLVDNSFINDYMPYADEKQIKVYLYGLFLCNVKSEKNFDDMIKTLNLSEEEILSAFTFWQEMGYVDILSKSPLEINYLSYKQSFKPVKKYKAGKFADFNVGLQELFPERMLTPTEFNEYYYFLDNSKIEESALLMIVKFCINLKGNTVRYPYILTVAKSWVAEGIKTVADVDDKLNELETQTEDMRIVLKALGRKTGADLEEKQLLLKWTKNWGYTIPAIEYAAKHQKSKTFKRLDQVLDDYYRLNIFTESQMADYNSRREKLYDLTIKINKTIGVYYESLDNVIETYTLVWEERGYNEDALLKIAHYCFLSGIRNLEGLNSMINKLYKLGIVTAQSIDNYISNQLIIDKKIKAILEAAGEIRNVKNNDRDLYRTWDSVWGFSYDIILHAAKCAQGKTYPIGYINQLLSSYKSNSIDTLEKAKSFSFTPQTTKTAVKDYMTREYSKEELQAIFKDAKNFDGSDIE